MRCKINEFCVLAAVYFSWPHERHDAPPLAAAEVDHKTRVVLEKKVGKPKDGWTYQSILVAILIQQQLLVRCRLGTAGHHQASSVIDGKMHINPLDLGKLCQHRAERQTRVAACASVRWP
ncbi:MAG: hypothetical protein ACP5I8_03220 [Phycisphaerae bacterium]